MTSITPPTHPTTYSPKPTAKTVLPVAKAEAHEPKPQPATTLSDFSSLMTRAGM